MTSNRILCYALAAHRRGYKILPIRKGTKRPIEKWDPWCDEPSVRMIRERLSGRDDLDTAIILGDGLIVFDADTPESVAALYYLEEQFDLSPSIIVNTNKGEHHWFRRDKDSIARSQSHASDKHPERIDIKTGRAIAVCPPSTDKSFAKIDNSRAEDLTVAPQAYIDAVIRHNGQEPLSQIDNVLQEPTLNVDQPLDAAADLALLANVLSYIDADVGYDEWVRVGMACHHVSGGSAEGLRVFDEWSAKGAKYPGARELAKKYASFGNTTGRRVSIGSTIYLARELGISEDIIEAAHNAAMIVDLDCGETEGLDVMNMSSMPTSTPAPANDDQNTQSPGAELLPFSLRGKSSLLSTTVVDAPPVLESIAVHGQFSLIFAAPNLGKTLITNKLLLDGIAAGNVNPEDVFYINADDNAAGLKSKLAIAEEARFHMLAPGLEGFNIDSLSGHLVEMTRSGCASGAIVIVDTIKKVVDPMDKTACRRFTNVARPFVTAGGTFIGLAHVNKNPGKDGDAVYGGTTDLRDDADCAFTLSLIEEKDGKRTVEFRNIKSRGGVIPKVRYRYSTTEQSYSALLASVESVSVDERSSPQDDSQERLLLRILDAISGGHAQKTQILKHVRNGGDFTRAEVERALESGTGSDFSKHYWIRHRGPNNAWVYSLLVGPVPSSESNTGPAD